jgi:hypothetical protein
MSSYVDANGNGTTSGSWNQWIHDAQVMEGKASGPLNYPLGTYTTKTDIPSLAKITKPDFPDFDLNIPDQYRADLFQQDFALYGKNGNLPALNMMWLMNDHTEGTAPGSVTTAHVADNDLALALTLVPAGRATGLVALAWFERAAAGARVHRARTAALAGDPQRHRRRAGPGRSGRAHADPLLRGRHRPGAPSPADLVVRRLARPVRRHDIRGTALAGPAGLRRVYRGLPGRRLHRPAVGVERGQAADHFGFLAPLVQLDNPVSSDRTRVLLNWEPAHPGLIDDLGAGHYFATAAA